VLVEIFPPELAAAAADELEELDVAALLATWPPFAEALAPAPAAAAAPAPAAAEPLPAEAAAALAEEAAALEELAPAEVPLDPVPALALELEELALDELEDADALESAKASPAEVKIPTVAKPMATPFSVSLYVFIQ